MTEHKNRALLGWVRDADGDSKRFTGEGIYERTGDWCMDRWRRGIPTITTFYYREKGRYFTFTVAAVPERAVPLRARLRDPDETVTLEVEGVRPWTMLAYQSVEDA